MLLEILLTRSFRPCRTRSSGPVGRSVSNTVPVACRSTAGEPSARTRRVMRLFTMRRSMAAPRWGQRMPIATTNRPPRGWNDIERGAKSLHNVMFSRAHLIRSDRMLLSTLYPSRACGRYVGGNVGSFRKKPAIGDSARRFRHVRQYSAPSSRSTGHVPRLEATGQSDARDATSRRAARVTCALVWSTLRV